MRKSITVKELYNKFGKRHNSNIDTIKRKPFCNDLMNNDIRIRIPDKPDGPYRLLLCIDYDPNKIIDTGILTDPEEAVSGKYLDYKDKIKDIIIANNNDGTAYSFEYIASRNRIDHKNRTVMIIGSSSSGGAGHATNIYAIVGTLTTPIIRLCTNYSGESLTLAINSYNSGIIPLYMQPMVSIYFYDYNQGKVLTSWNNFKEMNTSTASAERKALYIYIPGLYPYGLLYAPQVAGALLSIKGKDAIIYQRRSTDLKTELSNFKHFIEIFKRNYQRFIIIGHSYGAVYAKYFSANIPCSVYVSLDGSDLKESCAYIAYDLLNIDHSKKIDYTGDYPTCDGHNLVKEWFEPTVQATIKDYGKNILEVSWREWIRNTKLVNTARPKKSLIFTYYPNPKQPNKVAVIKHGSSYEIHYGKTYSHSLHMDPDVCKTIIDIIDGVV